MEVVSSKVTLDFFEEQYQSMKIRYGDMKKQLGQDIVSYTAPFREKIKAIAADESYLHKIVTLGAEKARESASATLREARHAIGVRHF